MKMLILICSLVIISIYFLWKKKWEIIKVSGESMSPTLQDGDLVLIDKTSPVRLGDIIVLNHPISDYLIIKRITGIKKHGNETVYYVMGDNRSNSIDSRNFGYIKEEHIEGRVIKSWKRK